MTLKILYDPADESISTSLLSNRLPVRMTQVAKISTVGEDKQ